MSHSSISSSLIHAVPPCIFHILPLLEFYCLLLCHKGTCALFPPPPDYWHTFFFFLVGPGPLHEMTFGGRVLSFFRRTHLVVRSTYVYMQTCLEEEYSHKPVWELHTSAAIFPVFRCFGDTTRRTEHHLFRRPPRKRKLVED